LRPYSKRRFYPFATGRFGFKKGSSRGHAIYPVKKIVDYYVNGGSTVNVCVLDLSKAFDKINHSALFIKLMDRLIPVQVLSILENWFAMCLLYVKWGSVFSRFYELNTGVRQGGVLSPYLFRIFIDDLSMLIRPMLDTEFVQFALLYFCMPMMSLCWHRLSVHCSQWWIFVLLNLNF